MATDELRSAMAIAHVKCSAARPAPRYAIVRSDCPYAHRHLQQAFSRRPSWRVFATEAAFRQFARLQVAAGLPTPALAVWIDEYENVPWDEIMKPPCLATNNFLIRKGLARKANFASVMARHATRCGSDCPLVSSVPFTVCIDTMPVFVSRSPMIDFASAFVECLIDAEEAMEEGGAAALWILKPSLSNKGAEIFLIREMPELKAALLEWRDVGQWVMQRYIDRPLLPGGRKFHLRVYVLAVGALQVYVFQEALALFAIERYSADLSRTHAHITNTCVNAGHADFNETDYVKCSSELPRTFLDACLCSSLEAGCAAVENIWEQIYATVNHCFKALESAVGAYMPLANAYELYGVDFLVTDEFMVRFHSCCCC